MFQCSLQIDQTKAAMQQLLSDLNNKDQAITIDQAAQAISQPPRSYNAGNGKETLENQAGPGGALPGKRTITWARNSEKNVQLSQCKYPPPYCHVHDVITSCRVPSVPQPVPETAQQGPEHDQQRPDRAKDHVELDLGGAAGEDCGDAVDPENDAAAS